MAARDRPDEFYGFEALWRQYRACRRNKRNTINALRFELNAEANLLALQRELRDHTYRPGPSICFVTEGPKPREVFAADFRDRIVHHVLVSHQEPVFERTFIAESYACRKGRGTLAASDRLMQFLRQATANGRRPAWALHLDVASFFPSIRKDTLYDLSYAGHLRHAAAWREWERLWAPTSVADRRLSPRCRGTSPASDSRASATATCARACLDPRWRPIADAARRSHGSSNVFTCVTWSPRYPARAGGASPTSGTTS